MTRTPMTKIAFTVYSAVAVAAALMITSADLAAAPRRGMGAGMVPSMSTGMAPPKDGDMGAGMGTGMAPPKDGDMGAGMDAGMQPDTDPSDPSYNDPPSPDEVLQPDEHIYRPVRLEVRKIVWFDPGQRGLLEAHPLVMGLAAMALATVTLLFFFLHGIKRPKDGDI